MMGQAEADDITQETFIKLYNYLNSDNNIRNPKAWLYCVAVNLCRTKLRRINNFRHIINKKLNTCNPVSSVETDYLKKEKINLVKKALKKLSPREQILLQLYREGLSYAEIAETAGVNKNSVGSMLSRAIHKMAKMLKEE